MSEKNRINPETKENMLEAGKNPGLGIKELHDQGIDGRGVRVAIIDQKLPAEHQEYKDSVVGYQEYGLDENENASMHGPAVASLLVGKTCGVAPGAELMYKAVPGGRNFKMYVEALADVIKFNKTVAPSEKIRIVSCSIGYMEENPESGLDEWIKTINKAKDSGIIFIDPSDDYEVNFIGGGSLDKENADSYDFALFMEKYRQNGKQPEGIIVPSDYRTMASPEGANEFIYQERGGISWSIPYLAGMYAMALQVNPDLTQLELDKLTNETAITNKKGLKIINPKGIIEAIK